MPANKVDILFAIDASESMNPCFQKLRENLRRFLAPLNQASFSIRFGLLAYNMGVFLLQVASAEPFICLFAEFSAPPN